MEYDYRGILIETDFEYLSVCVLQVQIENAQPSAVRDLGN